MNIHITFKVSEKGQREEIKRNGRVIKLIRLVMVI